MNVTKKMMKKGSGILVVAIVALSLCGLAQADTFSWTYLDPLGSVAGPHSYLDTTNAYTITARGYRTEFAGPGSPSLGNTWGPGAGYTRNTGTITSANLYGKNDGPGETGLGLAFSIDHEIRPRSFVQLDVSDLISNGFDSFTLHVGSVQIEEGYYVWGSDVLGVPGDLLGIGRSTTDNTVDQTFAVPSFGDYTYISVSATPRPGDAVSDVVIWSEGDREGGGQAQLFGLKWFDQNGNGVQDGAEIVLPNWTVYLKDEFGNLLGTTTTDSFGRFEFLNLDNAKYIVEEQQQSPTWAQTFPYALGPSGDNWSALNGGYLVDLTVFNSPTTGGLLQSLDFGNRVVVPEPAALSLLALGVFGLARKRRS